MTARFVLSVLVYILLAHATTSQQLSNEGKAILDIVLRATVIFLAADCLECWNGLCLPDGNTPNCALTDNDCIDYGGVDRTGPMLAQPGNMMLCCEAAAGYVDTVNLTQMTLDTASQSSCSSPYNEQPEGNFNEDNFIILGQQRQYVFPSIQFGCKGCISNITFYTRSQQQGESTIFNILLWDHYRNQTENSEVFELKQNYSVNMTESLTFIEWNTDSYSTTITLGSQSVCFDSGYVFGLSVSSISEFNLAVYREKSSSTSTAVYSRTRSPCESLGTLFYPNSNHIGGNVLVAVGVREETNTTVMMNVSSTLSAINSLLSTAVTTATNCNTMTKALSLLSTMGLLSSTTCLQASSNAIISTSVTSTIPSSSASIQASSDATVTISITVGFLTIFLISTTAFMTTITILVVILRRKHKKSKIMVQQLAATASNQQTEMQENYSYGQTEYELIINNCMHNMFLHVFYVCE